MKSSRLMSSAAWNVVSLLATGAAMLITAPMLVSRLGSDGYGLYMLVLAISGFAGMLDLGLGEATLRFAAGYLAQGDSRGVNRIFGATLFVYAITSFIAAGGILLLSGWIVSLLSLSSENALLGRRMLMIGAGAYIINTIASAFRAMSEAAQRYDLLALAKVVLSTLHAAALVGGAILFASPLVLVLCTLGYSLACLGVYMALAKRLVPSLVLLPRPSRAGLREVFGYGVFAFANQIISRISKDLDRLLLGIFFGPAQVAWLSVPKDLLARGSGITSSIGRVLFPRFSRMREDAHMLDLFLTSTWALLAISLVGFVPAVVLMPAFLDAWMGPTFAASAARPAQLLAGAFALTGAFAPYFSLLKGTDRLHWLTIIFLTTTGLGIAATAVLVPLLGVLGAALRYWVAVWCGFVVIAVVTRKIFHASIGKHLLPALVSPVLLSALLGAGFWLCAQALEVSGWAAVLASWALMSSVLALGLWGCNRLLTGAQGPAGQVWQSLRRLPRRRESTLSAHTVLNPNDQKESAA